MICEEGSTLTDVGPLQGAALEAALDQYEFGGNYDQLVSVERCCRQVKALEDQHIEWLESAEKSMASAPSEADYKRECAEFDRNILAARLALYKVAMAGHNFGLFGEILAELQRLMIQDQTGEASE